jgi:hypothetical protein
MLMAENDGPVASASRPAISKFVCFIKECQACNKALSRQSPSYIKKCFESLSVFIFLILWTNGCSTVAIAGNFAMRLRQLLSSLEIASTTTHPEAR